MNAPEAILVVGLSALAVDVIGRIWDRVGDRLRARRKRRDAARVSLLGVLVERTKQRGPYR